MKKQISSSKTLSKASIINLMQKKTTLKTQLIEVFKYSKHFIIFGASSSAFLPGLPLSLSASA